MQQAGERESAAEAATARDELATLVAASVQVPSVTGAERAVAEWYLEWMRSRGWDAGLQPLGGSALEHDEAAGDRANVLAYPFGRPTAGDRVLVINGHIDVVPAGDPATWLHPPFSGAREGGRVHGRGAVDTKGGVGAALFALESLRRADARPTLVPVVHLVIGEELTGVGTRLALAGGLRPAAAIVLEPTGGDVVTACSGLQFFELTARGRAAHSSAPWRGVDALARLLMLREVMIETAAARSMAFHHRRFADVPTGIPFTVGTLEAGTYRAAVPDAAVMTGRIGLRPDEDPAAARAEFERALARAVLDDPLEPELPHQLTWAGAPYPGWETDEATSVVSAFVAALEAVDGQARLRGFTAGNDAGQYAAAGAATVVFGPGDATLAHTSDESVSDDELVRAARVLARVIEGVS